MTSKAIGVSDFELINMLTDAAAEHRQIEYLEKYAPQSEELAIRYENRLYHAIAHRAYGVAHTIKKEHKPAKTRLSKALEIFKEFDTQWQIGRTYYELGNLAVSEENTVDAKKHFEKAKEHFTQMGSVSNLKQTQTALDTLNHK